MTDDMTDTAPGKADTQDNKAAIALGHALWMASMDKDSVGDAESRRTGWQQVKRDHIRMAKTVLRRLEKRGYTLVGSSASADSADEA